MRRCPIFAVLPILACAALIAGCEGDQGDPGPQGPAGPAGPAGPPATGSGGGGGIPVSSVQDSDRMTAEVTSVTVPAGGGAPVVTFKLTNDLTQGLTGIAPGDVRFTIAQLKPGVGGGSSAWRSYVTRKDGAQVQGTSETAEAARFVDNGNGTYSYTFKNALTAYADAPAYDGTLTHRVGVEIRNNAPTNNGPLDFIPAGGTVSTQRLIVDNDNCQACHDVLEFHGGARFDTQYCVTCHNPYTIDGQAPNSSVDMKVMIHKIHGAEHLRAISAPPYVVIGHNNTPYDFSQIVYPQDVRNCTTCHDETDDDTPQASNWRMVANREACGTCHADVNFAAGGHPGGMPFTDDTQCLSCHGPESSVTGSRGQLVRIEAAHQIPLDVKSDEFAYQVVSVTDTSNGPLNTGDTPRVTIKVVNPKNNTPYNIQDPAGPFKLSGASLRADLAWTGTEFSNVGSSANTPTGAPFQPVAVNFLAASGVTMNPDTSFTADAIGFVLPDRAARLPGADPALLTGGLVAILEGKPRFDPDGAGPEPLSNVKVTAGGKAEAWDGSATTRPNIVDINRCNECHNVLSLHGDGRTGSTQLCTTCHNPNATDISRHAAASGGCATGTPDGSIDFPVLIHSIHASARRAEQGAPPYTVCGYNNTFYDFSHVHYPGKINNCENCHVPPTSSNPSYYGRDPAKRLAITTRAGADRTVLIDDTADSPTAGTCVACHATSTAMTHMKQNGGVFAGLKQPNGQVVGQAETCSLCHGPGATADLREVHNIDFYPLNNP